MAESDREPDDLTMQIYKVFGEVLVDGQSAVEIARLVIRSRFGPEELARQEPLQTEDGADHWVIVGAATPDFLGQHSGALVSGRVEIEISKSDGRIRKFALNGHIAP